MNRPLRPIMSVMRMRRSDAVPQFGDVERPMHAEENACRRSSFEKPAKPRSRSVLTPYQMMPHSTLNISTPTRIRISPSRVMS